MNRTLAAIILSAIVAFAATARTASQFFAQAPDSIVRLLPQSTRLDMIDYFDYGSTRPSDNYLGGSARVIASTDRLIDIQIDENVEMQIALVAAKADTIVAVVTTVRVPYADSSIKFYDTAWRPLRKPPLAMPAYDEWLTDEGRLHRADIRIALPFMPVSASFDDDASHLRLTNHASQYLGNNPGEPYNQWIVGEKNYTATHPKFTPDR